MTYCDTNILTAFVNREDLMKNFGNRGFREYPNIRGVKDKRAGLKLKEIEKCSISKKALMNDIRGHQASMGAILTSIGLKEINIENVDGFDRGKKIFEEACFKKDKDLNNFKNNFCINNQLKKNLRRNQIEDIRHLGSAIELGEKDFITGDRKDFQPLNKFVEINII